MSKLQYNRLFRFLVCLVLVLSFLVNLSPLKADATAVVGGVLTFEGLMAALYSMGIGIVATELTVEAWNNIGNSLTKAITDTGDSTITEAWIDLEAMYDSYIPGGGQDPDDELKWAEKLKHALSRGLLGAIAGWLCTLVNLDGFEISKDSAEEGFAFYNGVVLPTFNSIASDYPNYPYYTIFYSRYSNEFRLLLSNYQFCCHIPIDSIRNFHYEIDSPKSRLYVLSADEFIFNKSSTGYLYKNYDLSTEVNSTHLELIWTNYDYINITNNSVYMAGSEPTTTQTEIIEPTIYVGDIPQQIKDGEKDKDTLILPPIDPFRVIQFPDTALNDVNQLQQQLADGTITLDQYLDNVKLQDPTVDPDPSTPSDPSTGTDTDSWEPPSDPGAFALDLSKFFPFCIPFDLYAFLTCLNADPVTPVIHWEIAMPGGGSYPLTIDLSPFDSVAQLLRRLELLLFCVGLAIKTRDLIKG